MEVQLTDFENTAFEIFLVLYSRMVLTKTRDFRIPISKVDINFRTAYQRDAVLDGRFYFRGAELADNDYQPWISKTGSCTSAIDSGNDTNHTSGPHVECTRMSMNDIFNGNATFPGLLPLITDHLTSTNVDISIHKQIKPYLNFISRRASGDVKTLARWLRDQVLQHPEYQNDSVVTETITYDILKKCSKISSGETSAPDFTSVHA